MDRESTLNKRLDNYEIITETGCWLWMGGLSGTGYGGIEEKGKSIGTHRANYEKLVRPLNSKEVLRHTCDIRCCINPSHLIPGTTKENQEDKVRRGRSLKGIKNSQSKLTENQVIEIYKSGKSQRELGREYKVSSHVVFLIIHRKTWTHVTEGLTRG